VTGTVLLLSGGLDSSSLAAWIRPDACLFVDYGQLAAGAERQASERVTNELALRWFELSVDCGAVGSGLMSRRPQVALAPSPEWWPFRNQLLGTLAVAWALARGFTDVAFGAVRGDGARHSDGSQAFFRAFDALVSGQEGGIRIGTPAIELSTEDLIAKSGIRRSVLGLTFSCHAANPGCGACPGCAKRTAVFDSLSRPTTAPT
jgi:7-cyano-7-deazaguanine synthase